MANQQIVADPIKLRNMADDIGKCHTALRNHLQTSKGQVDSLKGVWTGEAASAFSASFQTIYQKCSESLEAVSRLSKTLYESADAYDRNEKAVQQEASKLPKLPNNVIR